MPGLERPRRPGSAPSALEVHSAPVEGLPQRAVVQLSRPAILRRAQSRRGPRRLPLSHRTNGIPGRHMSLVVGSDQHARREQVVDSRHPQRPVGDAVRAAVSDLQPRSGIVEAVRHHVVVDLVTTSASGLDPDISPANALAQAGQLRLDDAGGRGQIVEGGIGRQRLERDGINVNGRNVEVRCVSPGDGAPPVDLLL